MSLIYSLFIHLTFKRDIEGEFKTPGPAGSKGSEHSVDDKYSDMEMQMVFFDRRCSSSVIT